MLNCNDRRIHSIIGSLFYFTVVLTMTAAREAEAEDWGAYSIIPVSGNTFVLEVVGAGTEEGSLISINKPAGTPHQKWTMTPKGEKYFTISPLNAPKMVMSASKGGQNNGTPIILEKDGDEPRKQWELRKLPGGFYRIVPRHAEDMGLDHLGGKKAVGAQIDLWKAPNEDQHLQWLIKPLAGTQSTAEATFAEMPPEYTPPEIKPENVPAGRMEKFVFNQSKVFPGTNREVNVFIPAQYDGSKPACVYVKTDGFNPVEKGFLENLIAAKQIPVMIGIFVRPGDLPPTVKGTMGRRNRCFEYDGVGEENARFLVDELLPYIAKQYGLKLSDSGNDRCIAGGSSGGIAAFNAAFYRPDAFTRVYANSGSFVAFRGGHEFPTLIRKFEAKPIRSFLTTGMRDMENCAGDWFLIDLEIDKAMKFSGYDYKFRVINGGHVAGYYDYFHDAMTYIWKDWPTPVSAGPSAPRVRDVILPNEDWHLVSQSVQGTTSAACSPKGEPYFVSATQNKIFRIDAEDKVHEFLADAGHAHGLSFAANGQLLAVPNTPGKLMSYDATGKGTVIADDIRGRHIQAMPNGGVYGTFNDESKLEGGSVWFVKDGKKTTIDQGLKFATGLAYRPDQWLLSVADGRSKWAYSYQINEDGTLTNRERFFWFHVPDWEDQTDAETVCYVKEGQMFVATNWGIQVCTDDGPNQVILPLPDRSQVLSICFGGPDFDTLYAFTADKIWKRKLKVHGIGAFSPWTAARGLPL